MPPDCWAVMNEGDNLGSACAAGSRPEDIIVARNIIFCLTGAHIHSSTSARRLVDLIRVPRHRASATGEASPHHIEFTDACPGRRHALQDEPPLRSADIGTIEVSSDGTDCIANDHASTQKRKGSGIRHGLFGIIGLENALAASPHLYHSGRMRLSDVIVDDTKVRKSVSSTGTRAAVPCRHLHLQSRREWW